MLTLRSQCWSFMHFSASLHKSHNVMLHSSPTTSYWWKSSYFSGAVRSLWWRSSSQWRPPSYALTKLFCGTTSNVTWRCRLIALTAFSLSDKPLNSPIKVRIRWEWTHLFLVKLGLGVSNIHLINCFSYQSVQRLEHHAEYGRYKNGLQWCRLGVFSLSLLSSRLWIFCATIILYPIEGLLEVPAILCAGSFPMLRRQMIYPFFHDSSVGQQRWGTCEHFNKCKCYGLF